MGNDRGVGLFGMKERAELVGSGFDTGSLTGQGTTVYISVPALFNESKA